MKLAHGLFLIAASLTLAASVIAGQNPVGAWKGHVVIDASKMTIKDPNQVKIVKQRVAAAEKVQVTLTLNANKTFSGGPPPSSGTWVQKGNIVTLTATNAAGKSGNQVFVLSKDGKTMTNTLPASAGITAKIVVTR
jgi:hypothetical protein